MTGTALWSSLVPADAAFAPSRVAVGARGTTVQYADGSERLCATSGLWNVPLGYGHPAVTDAVARALHDASYLTLFRSVHRPALEAADTLRHLVGAHHYRRVVFTTSGGAAVDAALKLVRHFWVLRGQPGRRVVVGLQDSYHGTMYGGHALGADDLLHEAYALDRRAIRHIPLDDGTALGELAAREGDRIAAIVLEPIQGSGGRPVPAGLLARVAELRERYGTLVVADEVATGFGRTGALFASERWPIRPDVLLLSKALSNGTVGTSALVVADPVAALFRETGATFVHGETHAGTPAACAAVEVVAEEIDRVVGEHRVDTVAALLRPRLDGLVRDGVIRTWRGEGLFLVVHLAEVEDGTATSLALVDAVAESGAIVHPSPVGLQLFPAYVFTSADADLLERSLRDGIARYRRGSA